MVKRLQKCNCFFIQNQYNSRRICLRRSMNMSVWNSIYEAIVNINGAINDFVWGVPCLVLLIGTGLYYTIRLGFMQFRHPVFLFKETVVKAFKKKDDANKAPGELTSFQAALTMSGIAGMVLSLGMAVDANVLIYERIREEFARGATAGKAVSAGYAKAFTAIVDSNITTILTGIILYVVGTGPVRGFAIMLTGGVVISMFTAIVVTRLVFDHTTDPNRTKPFKMVQFFKNPNFDFVALGNKALLISTIIIVVTLGLFTYRVFTKPTSVLAVDLTGGTSIVYDVKAGEANVGEIRKAINSFDNAALIQTGDNGSILSIKTGVDKGDTESQIKKLIDSSEALKGLELELKSCDQIGPTVGNDLRSSGTKAVIFSLIARSINTLVELIPLFTAYRREKT